MIEDKIGMCWKSDLVGLIKSFDQLEATQGARNKLIVVKINNVTQRAPGLWLAAAFFECMTCRVEIDCSPRKGFIYRPIMTINNLVNKLWTFYWLGGMPAIAH